jgi:hypothetical protein
MSKQTEISKPVLEKVREELEQLLEPFGEKYGLQLKTGRCSFSPSNFTMKLEGSLINEDGVVQTKESEDFKNFAPLFGLDPEDLGKQFRTGMDMYTITGLKTRAKKYPVVAVNEKGRSYKFPAENVKRLLLQAQKDLVTAS